MAQSEPEVIVILVGNQKDREQFREVSREKAEAFRARHNIPFFVETSAKSGENVELIFTMASKLLFHSFKDQIPVMVSVKSILDFLTCHFAVKRKRKVIERAS